MGHLPRPYKLFALILAFLFGGQSLFAHLPESNFWTERRKAAPPQSPVLLASMPVGYSRTGLAQQFPSPQILSPALSPSLTQSVPKSFLRDYAQILAALSPAHGTVRKVSFPQAGRSPSPLIIHIQDVHGNLDAQHNISETVRALLKTGQAGLLALEGSTEEINLQVFADCPHRQAVERTADYLLRENKISGPIHAALILPGRLPRILGIDDPIHYEANAQAYRAAVPTLEKTKREIQILAAEVEDQKKSVYSLPLQAFDHQIQAYHAGKVSLSDYVRTLLTVNAPSPEIRRFLDAIKREQTLNFQTVESERTRLIGRLTHTLTTSETNILLAKSLAYRAGQLRSADFYAQLKETCQKSGIPLTDFPAMDAYIGYARLADKIDAERLLEEIATLEKSAYTQLANTPEEKTLVRRARQTWLTTKLVDFSLTPAEWREYQIDETKRPLKHFESFYQEALARDTAMAKNLQNAIAPVTVLVTGGYHAEGLTRLLTQQGSTVLSYVPKIEKIDTAQGSTYLSVFTQEKTPLEKLAQGEKLFLAANPAPRSLRATLLPALVTLVLWGTAANIDPATLYQILGGIGVLSVVKIAKDLIVSKISFKGRQVTLTVSMDSGRISGHSETPVPPRKAFVPQFIVRICLALAVLMGGPSAPVNPAFAETIAINTSTASLPDPLKKDMESLLENLSRQGVSREKVFAFLDLSGAPLPFLLSKPEVFRGLPSLLKLLTDQSPFDLYHRLLLGESYERLLILEQKKEISPLYRAAIIEQWARLSNRIEKKGFPKTEQFLLALKNLNKTPDDPPREITTLKLLGELANQSNALLDRDEETLVQILQGTGAVEYLSVLAKIPPGVPSETIRSFEEKYGFQGLFMNSPYSWTSFLLHIGRIKPNDVAMTRSLLAVFSEFPHLPIAEVAKDQKIAVGAVARKLMFSPSRNTPLNPLLDLLVQSTEFSPSFKTKLSQSLNETNDPNKIQMAARWIGFLAFHDGGNTFPPTAREAHAKRVEGYLAKFPSAQWVRLGNFMSYTEMPDAPPLSPLDINSNLTLEPINLKGVHPEAVPLFQTTGLWDTFETEVKRHRRLSALLGHFLKEGRAGLLSASEQYIRDDLNDILASLHGERTRLDPDRIMTSAVAVLAVMDPNRRLTDLQFATSIRLILQRAVAPHFVEEEEGANAFFQFNREMLDYLSGHPYSFYGILAHEIKHNQLFQTHLLLPESVGVRALHEFSADVAAHGFLDGLDIDKASKDNFTRLSNRMNFSYKETDPPWMKNDPHRVARDQIKRLSDRLGNGNVPWAKIDQAIDEELSNPLSRDDLMNKDKEGFTRFMQRVFKRVGLSPQLIRGLATGWIGVAAAYGFGWAMGAVLKWRRQIGNDDSLQTFATEYVKENKGYHAAVAEDLLTTLVALTLEFGTALLFGSPTPLEWKTYFPILLLAILWPVALLLSHLFGQKKIQTVFEIKSDLPKALRLTFPILSIEIFSFFVGAGFSSFSLASTLFALATIPLMFPPILREIHKKINGEVAGPHDISNELSEELRDETNYRLSEKEWALAQDRQAQFMASPHELRFFLALRQRMNPRGKPFTVFIPGGANRFINPIYISNATHLIVVDPQRSVDFQLNRIKELGGTVSSPPLEGTYVFTRKDGTVVTVPKVSLRFNFRGRERHLVHYIWDAFDTEFWAPELSKGFDGYYEVWLRSSLSMSSYSNYFQTLDKRIFSYLKAGGWVVSDCASFGGGRNTETGTAIIPPFLESVLGYEKWRVDSSRWTQSNQIKWVYRKNSTTSNNDLHYALLAMNFIDQISYAKEGEGFFKNEDIQVNPEIISISAKHFKKIRSVAEGTLRGLFHWIKFLTPEKQAMAIDWIKNFCMAPIRTEKDYYNTELKQTTKDPKIIQALNDAWRKEYISAFNKMLASFSSSSPNSSDLDDPITEAEAKPYEPPSSNRKVDTSGFVRLTSLESTHTSGKAASLRMIQLAERIGFWIGGNEGRIMWGATYKRYADASEWSGALLAMILSTTAISLCGSSLSLWTISIVMGPLFGHRFYKSHFLPTREKRLFTHVVISPPKILTMAILYGFLIAVSPVFLGFIPGIDLGGYASRILALLWSAAGLLHHIFDREDPRRMAGEQAARDVVIRLGTISGALDTILPPETPGLLDQMTGPGRFTQAFLEKILTQLKSDALFRAGFIDQSRSAIESRTLPSVQTHLLSALIAMATGQPFIQVHFLGDSPLEMARIETLVDLSTQHSPANHPGGLRLALVVTSIPQHLYAARLDALAAKGVKIFNQQGETPWSEDSLRTLEKEMEPWLDKWPGVLLATIGQGILIKPANIQMLRTRLKVALAQAVSLSESVLAYFRFLQAIAANA